MNESERKCKVFGCRIDRGDLCVLVSLTARIGNGVLKGGLSTNDYEILIANMEADVKNGKCIDEQENLAFTVEYYRMKINERDQAREF